MAAIDWKAANSSRWSIIGRQRRKVEQTRVAPAQPLHSGRRVAPDRLDRELKRFREALRVGEHGDFGGDLLRHEAGDDAAELGRGLLGAALTRLRPVLFPGVAKVVEERFAELGA